jgi:hypothetical protein
MYNTADNICDACKRQHNHPSQHLCRATLPRLRGCSFYPHLPHNSYRLAYGARAYERTNAKIMFFRQLSRVVRRESNVAVRRLRTTPCSFAKVNLLGLRVRLYSTSRDGKTPSNQDKIGDDTLRELDIDAIEAHSKNWFGDQSAWSHEKLLNLMVCKLRLLKN